MVSAFYSLQDTKTPVKIAAVAMLINIALSILLMGPMKHGGLALATAVSSMVNFLSLFYILRMRLGRLGLKRTTGSVLKSGLASLLMALVATKITEGPIWQLQGWVFKKVFFLAGAISISVVIYLCLSYILKPEELKQFWGAIRGRHL
ncbi:MAG: hypothetical protein D6778_10540 [Nitrospirae bacterium]|nr:MAG: hypothetical protein D6778_10540 [Nitrospirota bacterium]